MHTETTRRAFIAGSTAIAVAAAVPAHALAVSSPAWESVKRDFTAACRRFGAAVDASLRADGEQIDFDKTAPERKLTYTEEGFSIINEKARLEMAASEETFTLTRRNYHSSAVPKLLASSPGYVAYGEALAVWKAERERLAHERGWDAVEQEWQAAFDAREAAWRNLMAFPVAGVLQLAEKVQLARVDYTTDEEKAELLDAVAADLARIAPKPSRGCG